MNEENIKKILKSRLLEKRYIHSLNVMEMAVRLARINGVDENDINRIATTPNTDLRYFVLDKNAKGHLLVVPFEITRTALGVIFPPIPPPEFGFLLLVAAPAATPEPVAPAEPAPAEPAPEVVQPAPAAPAVAPAGSPADDEEEDVLNLESLDLSEL